MTRTLVISDLHVGAHSGRSVLESRGVRDELFGRLADFDRLVLLGDTLELGEGRPSGEVIEIAAPLLSGLGRNVREILILPGNHDRLLVRPWLADQGETLELEGVVPPDSSPLLREMTERLGAGGAEVSVHYPGVRLSERVWMTHGHYMDRELSPEGPYGMFRRPTAHTTPAAYERRPVRASRQRVVKATEGLLTPRFARMTAAGLDLQMRHRSMPALASALAALGVRAEYVVFGHVHRLGPIAGDRAVKWQYVLAPGDAPTRFLNTGSWRYEDLLIGSKRPPHPYWPGGSVVIGEEGVPHAVGLLDQFDLTSEKVPSAATR
jgi:UDP-2,3-diacylglucosamine pyrophosphatase LpxH